MDFEIKEDLNITICGFSDIVVNNNFKDTGFRLMNKMWERIRASNLRHKELNTWVYEGSKLFTGVEMEEAPPVDSGLELKQVKLA